MHLRSYRPEHRWRLDTGGVAAGEDGDQLHIVGGADGTLGTAAEVTIANNSYSYFHNNSFFLNSYFQLNIISLF